MEDRNDRLRICFVPPQFSPSVGGAQVQTEKQARMLLDLGHDVLVVTLRLKRQWAQQMVLDGLTVVRVGGIYKPDGTLRMGRFGIWPAAVGVLLELWRRRHTYDVIHTSQMSLLAAAAALIGRLTRKPVIIRISAVRPIAAGLQTEARSPLADTSTDRSSIQIESSEVDRLQSDIIDMMRYTLGGRQVLYFLRKSRAYYQALSTRSVSYLTSWGFAPERIVHISGSVDTEKFRPTPEERPDPCGPERTIVCVARLEYQKGVDVLLSGWERMLRTSTEWQRPLLPKLCLIGDGALRPTFERLAADLNIRDSVEFLGVQSDIVGLLQQSWGFALPSRNEGMSNALLEAMACGLPCVATRVSGSEDVIADGLNGILVEPDQPTQMAEALRRLLEDSELAQRLGHEARATVVRDYQLSHNVERCLALYRHVLAEQAQRTSRS